MMLVALTVLTLKSAVARDFHGGTKGLSDKMARDRTYPSAQFEAIKSDAQGYVLKN